ncbi:MAG: hypothetical protein OHK0021_19530 [Bryobacter sp.]
MGGPGMGGGMNIPAVTVILETTAPVAAAKARLDRVDSFSEATKDYVVISVVGLRMMGGGRRGPNGEAPDPERMAQMQQMMEQRLLQSTTLTTKEKKTFAPSAIKLTRGETANTASFTFPRNDLNLDTKEFTFKTGMGPMEIVAKFNTKDLAFDGKPAY